MGGIPDSPLGKATHYPDRYDPSLLYPIERAPQRAALGLGGALPFAGVDRWTAWEAEWLDDAGRPRVAIVTFDVPCGSPRIVESKSVKLWLASLNHARFASPAALREALRGDLAGATGADVDVAVHLPDAWPVAGARRAAAGVLLDDTTPAAWPEAPDPGVLACGGATADETLVLRAFRSVCPVTGQPDYAELSLAYRGPRIVPEGLYAYLLGFRRHPGFHEHCVERIYVDVARVCRPQRLCVEARFARRGGVDIHPLRASGPPPPPSPPGWRT